MTDRRLLLLRVGAYVAVHLFLLTILQPLTIALFWLTLLVTKSYVKLCLTQLIQKGLIVYFPENLQRTLRERSPFDLMCDLWFIQSTSLIKVLMKPFFEQVQPDRAAEVLDELTPEMKERMLTKGIINILPQSLKQILSPDVRLTKSDRDRLERLRDIQLVPIYTQPSGLVEPSDGMRETPAKFRQTTVKEIPAKRMNTDTMNFDDENASEPSSDHTVVLPKPKMKPKLPAQWDKLSYYRNFRNRANSKENLFAVVKNSFATVRKLLDIKGMTVKSISYMTLAKLTCLFVLLLVVQLKVHPRSRNLILQALQILLGVVSALGAVGCVGMLVYKNLLIKQDREQSLKRIKAT